MGQCSELLRPHPYTHGAVLGACRHQAVVTILAAPDAGSPDSLGLAHGPEDGGFQGMANGFVHAI